RPSVQDQEDHAEEEHQTTPRNPTKHAPHQATLSFRLGRLDFFPAGSSGNQFADWLKIESALTAEFLIERAFVAAAGTVHDINLCDFIHGYADYTGGVATKVTKAKE